MRSTSVHRNQSEQQVDGAGDDDVEQDVSDAVARVAIDLLRVIEEHVDAAPLLQHGQGYADQQWAAQGGREQFEHAGLRHLRFAGDGSLNGEYLRGRRRLHRRGG